MIRRGANLLVRELEEKIDALPLVGQGVALVERASVGKRCEKSREGIRLESEALLACVSQHSEEIRCRFSKRRAWRTS